MDPLFSLEDTSIPTLPELLQDPLGCKAPSNYQAQVITALAYARHANEHNIDPMLRFMGRFPEEVQMVFVKMVLSRDYELERTPPLRDWMRERDFGPGYGYYHRRHYDDDSGE